MEVLYKKCYNNSRLEVLMQHKTSSKEFEDFGNVYEAPINMNENNMISIEQYIPAKRYADVLLYFNEEVCIELQSGLAVMLVSFTPDVKDIKLFAVHRFIKLKPNIYFNIMSVSPNSSYKIITHANYKFSSHTLEPPYKFNRILPTIHINEILGYYYSIRNSGYRFKGERHNYYELTFIDRGSLITEVEGKTYTLNEKDILIYTPGQFHTQSIEKGSSCSYVTIIFDMKIFVENNTANNDEFINNRIFGYDKKIYNLINSFVQESSTQIPYMNSLMLCLLQEIIIRLLQLPFLKNINSTEKNDKPASPVHKHYQDELLEKILDFINDSIYEPITIFEICQKFSLSRSSLQILFKENMDTTPKKYIINMKLEKSCQMIREEKYTISNIALLLGFNSIHYFSRAFTQKYSISPSEYAKQMLKI